MIIFMDTPTNLPDPRAWVIYQDEDILVINKPAGLLSIADGYHQDLPHLSQVLEPYFGRIWMVHRLDKNTSGTLLVARNSTSHRQLNFQFKERQVHKLYHCLVRPVPIWQEITMNEPLLMNADRAHRTRVNFDKGKPAETHARVILHEGQIAMLECEILTGYTHQIRAHLYHQGIGILGDCLYQPNRADPSTTQASPLRLMLHARQLTFLHPVTGRKMDFTAEYPLDFSEYLRQIQAHSPG